MIELRIEGQNLDLDDDSAASITAANPALDPERLGRAYTYPFRVPHTPRNLAVLKHQHRIDASTNVQEQPAELRLGGLPFVSGRAIVAEHTHRNTEVTVQNEDLSSLEKLSDIKLHDLLGSIEIPQDLDARFVLEPGEGPIYQFTVNDVLYQAGGLGVPKIDAMIELSGDINADHPGFAFYDNINDQLIFTTDDDDIRVAYDLTAYTLITERTLAQAREANIQAFITATIATPRADIAWPVTYELAFYGPLNRRWSGYFNWRLDGAYQNNSHFDAPRFRVSYKPLVRLRYLLDLVAAEAGLRDIVFDLDADLASDLESILLYNNYALDELRFEQVLSDNLGSAYMLAPLTSIDLKNHVLDISAAELIQGIVKYFNLHHAFDRGTLYLRRNLDQIQQQPTDWTSYTGEAYERTSSAGTGVTISLAPGDDPAPNSLDEGVTIGDGENELVLPVRPMFYQSPNNAFGDRNNWLVPVVEQRGTSEAYALETELDTLRFVFDRGQQNDAGGDAYHQASPLGAHFSLLLTGKNNLYETFWKGWTPFLFSPIITRTIWLPLPDLLHILTYASPLVRIYSAHGDAIALVRSVQFRVGSQGIGAAKVEFNRQG